MIETERLRLDPLRAEHARLVFESLQEERLYEFIPEDPPATLRAKGNQNLPVRLVVIRRQARKRAARQRPENLTGARQ